MNFKNQRDPKFNLFHSAITIKGTKTQIKMIKREFLQHDDKIEFSCERYDVHAVETVILLMKTFELYKDEIDNAQEILEFAVKYVKTGLLNGLPYINSIDKNFYIIHEVMEYINEVRCEFYASTFYEDPQQYKYYNHKSFDAFLKNKKDNKQQELYYLYDNNVSVYDDFNHDLSNNVLESLLEDYEKNRDSIFYKLENVEYYIDEVLSDPLIDVRWWNDLGSGKKYELDDESILHITSNKKLTEFALYLSYEVPEIEVEVININEDYEIKRYNFKNGEYLERKLKRSEKVRILLNRLKVLFGQSRYEWVSETNKWKSKKLQAVPNKFLLDFVEVMKYNIGKLRVDSTVTIDEKDNALDHVVKLREINNIPTVYYAIPLSDIIFNIKHMYSYMHIGNKFIINPIYHDINRLLEYNTSETVLFMKLVLLLREYDVETGSKVFELLKTENRKLFKNKQKTKKLFKE